MVLRLSRADANRDSSSGPTASAFGGPLARSLIQTSLIDHHGTVMLACLDWPQTVVDTVQVPEAGFGPEFWCLLEPGVIG